METPLDDGAGCIGHHIVISILSIILVISVGMNILLKCSMPSRFFCFSEQTTTQEQTGQENYDNLSDTKETHLYTTMASTK